jgi:predicted nucleotidyltransferase
MSTTAEQMQLAVDLKDELLKAYNPVTIILFGSLGRGEGDEYSDVDLFVVIETDRDEKDLEAEMTRHLDPLIRDKHVIVRTPRRFCRQMDIPGTIDFSVASEGKALFEKCGWRNGNTSDDSYETRKQEVIQQDYLRSARDFQTLAEKSIENRNLFRCRDFARFSAVKVLKCLFVKNDIHPPRETDLMALFDKICVLEPDLEEYAAFLKDLNDYCPEGNNALEIQRCRTIVAGTVAFVEEVVGRCFTVR